MLHIIYSFKLRAEHCKQAKFHKGFGFVLYISILYDAKKYYSCVRIIFKKV